MLWQTGPKTSLLETGCRHQHSLSLFMRQLSFTDRVLLQEQMLLTGLLARLTWRTTLRRKDCEELTRRNGLGRSITGFSLRGIQMGTHNPYFIHFHLQDQEGHQEHISDLGTLFSPNIYHLYCFFLLLFLLFVSIIAFCLNLCKEST